MIMLKKILLLCTVLILVTSFASCRKVSENDPVTIVNELKLNDRQKEYLDTLETIESVRLIDNDIVLVYSTFNGKLFARVSDEVLWEMGPYNITTESNIHFGEEYIGLQYIDDHLNMSYVRLSYEGTELIKFNKYNHYVQPVENGYLFIRTVNNQNQVVYANENGENVIYEYFDNTKDNYTKLEVKKPMNILMELNMNVVHFYYLNENNKLCFVVIENDEVLLDKVLEVNVEDIIITEDAISIFYEDKSISIKDMKFNEIASYSSDEEYQVVYDVDQSDIVLCLKRRSDYVLFDLEGNVSQRESLGNGDELIYEVLTLKNGDTLWYSYEDEKAFLNYVDKRENILWSTEIYKYYFDKHDVIEFNESIVVKSIDVVMQYSFEGELLNTFSGTCYGILSVGEETIACKGASGLYGLDKNMDTVWVRDEYDYKSNLYVTSENLLIATYRNPDVNQKLSKPYLFEVLDSKGKLLSTLDNLYNINRVFIYNDSTFVVAKEEYSTSNTAMKLFTISGNGGLSEGSPAYYNFEYTENEISCYLYVYTGSNIVVYKMSEF